MIDLFWSKSHVAIQETAVLGPSNINVQIHINF